MVISIEDAEKKFGIHLNQAQNERIIFSGKFGTGKSYFLKQYFDSNCAKYNYIWLTPVNYVVGANQDIFEWIKIDIAKQLVANAQVNKHATKFTKNNLVNTYLYQNAASIFTTLLTEIAAAPIKKYTGFDFLKLFRKQINDYKQFEDGANEETKSDFQNLEEYIQKSFQVKGSIYEDDLTTQIIRASIQLLKLKSKKDTVLIIDDLDRLDPEHIFRILNIFSAHNDHFDSNKFGFDKAILVRDLDNIENLYKHKYGERVDFEGYIEKFYTYEPFYFNISDAIIGYCMTQKFEYDIDLENRAILSLLLQLFLQNQLLKIRSLKKIFTTHYTEEALFTPVKFYPIKLPHIPYEQFIQADSITVDYNRFDFLKVVLIISIAFGGVDKFKAALTKMSGQNLKIPNDYFQKFVHSASVLSHIAKNEPSHTLFYELPKNHRNEIFQTLPSLTFLGLPFALNLPWSSYNPYTQGHYFRDSKIRGKYGSAEQINIAFTVDKMFDEINTIINFMEKNNMIVNRKN